MKTYQLDLFPIRIGFATKSEIPYVEQHYDTSEYEHPLMDDSDQCITIFVKNKKDNAFTALIIIDKETQDFHIVHESVHAACDCLHFLGFELEEEGHNEMLCYMTEFIFKYWQDVKETIYRNL